MATIKTMKVKPFTAQQKDALTKKEIEDARLMQKRMEEKKKKYEAEKAKKK